MLCMMSGKVTRGSYLHRPSDDNEKGISPQCYISYCASSFKDKKSIYYYQEWSWERKKMAQFFSLFSSPPLPSPLFFSFLLSSPNFCQTQLERNERSCHLLDNSDLSCLFNKPFKSDTFLFCLFTFPILLVNKHVVMAGKNLIFQPVAGFEIKCLVISLALFIIWICLRHSFISGTQEVYSQVIF